MLLVIVTTLGAGWLAHLLVPDLGWPAAFALGAVISPTDAVAATSVGRELGLPSPLLTLLEGEGLVNDASALVLLRSAIAALAASVSVWDVAAKFLLSVVIAVAIGALVGVVNVKVRAGLDDTVLNTAITFVVPFVAYVPAEELNASGVLAVVVTGLVTGHLAPRLLRAQDRLGEEMNPAKRPARTARTGRARCGPCRPPPPPASALGPLGEVFKLGSASSTALSLLNTMVRPDNVHHLSKVEALDMELFDQAVRDAGTDPGDITERGLSGARGLPALLSLLNG
ncbi:cation:proton antiporter domain-containing protein [Streptomyces sp. NPDC051546]|uniref:cation:proton antiporter domain-containing protein n=1 Tax=Streptomyces sp. NPDC051546 TaxID=3365655 RepID=UPI0037902915